MDNDQSGKRPEEAHAPPKEPPANKQQEPAGLPKDQQPQVESQPAPRGPWWNGYRIAAVSIFVPLALLILLCISTIQSDPDGSVTVFWVICFPSCLLVAFLYIFAEYVYRHPMPRPAAKPPVQIPQQGGNAQMSQQYQQPMQPPVQPQPGPISGPQYPPQYPQGQFVPPPPGPQYIVLQVTLKEEFIGTGSRNLKELQNVINGQWANGYRLHTLSTASAHSTGFGGGDRIQATMVFERIF